MKYIILFFIYCIFSYFSSSINIYFDSNVPLKFFDSIEESIKIMNNYLILKRNITVFIKYDILNGYILAQCDKPKYCYADFYNFISYPSSLFKQLYNRDCINDFDIVITINSNFEDAFYYKLKERSIRFYEYDLQSIVLHELFHGLGFYTNFYLSDANKLMYMNMDIRLTIFDWILFKEKNITGFPKNISEPFYIQNITVIDFLINDNLIFCSFKRSLCFPLYAPSIFVKGTSIVHRNNYSLLYYEFYRYQQYNDIDIYSIMLLEEMGYETKNCNMPNIMKSCGYCDYLEPCNEYNYNSMWYVDYIFNHFYFLQIILNIIN